MSMKAVTGKPIKFAGVGEKLEDFEPFHPERMASRILGMGDVVSLVEKAAEAVDIDEAKRLDHRRLGRELELFMLHEWAPCATFWLPKGTIVYNTLQEKMRRLLQRNGYVEVKTPLLANEQLFKTSGHWQHYKDDMFIIEDEEAKAAHKENAEFPMPVTLLGMITLVRLQP